MLRRIPRSETDSLDKCSSSVLLLADDDHQTPPRATSFTQKALSNTANLANLLPTGTLLAFQLLTPLFTNNGSCDTATRVLTQLLLCFLAASAFLTRLTDSCVVNGQVYYGIVTGKDMWLFDFPATSTVPDLSRYCVRFADWLHAVLSVLVFGSVAMRDRNVVSCLYPQPKHEMLEVLDIVPIGVGLICSLLFVVFPTRRHGIGFPTTKANN